MNFRIVATLFFLIVLAMALIDGVIVVLWNHSLVTREVREAEKKMELLALGLGPGPAGKAQASRETVLPLVQKAFSGQRLAALFWLGTRQPEELAAGAKRWGLVEPARKAMAAGRQVVVKVQRPERFLWFGPIETAVIQPIAVAGQEDTAAVAVVLSSQKIVDELLHHQVLVAIYILLQAMILTTIGFFRLHRWLVRPVEELARIAENYQVSEGAGLFQPGDDSQYGQLARAMNSMLRRIATDRRNLEASVTSLARANRELHATRDEMIRTEKLAATGRLSAGLAHEIGNPVTVVQGYLELLRHDDLAPRQKRQIIANGLEELKRIDRLLRQMLDVARTEENLPEMMDISELVAEALATVRPALEKKNIAVRLSASGTFTVRGRRDGLKQVMINLLLNAADAIAEREEQDLRPAPKIRVEIDHDPQGSVGVCVVDNGQGIHAADLGKVFEPFFTTKEPGRGTGLGLWVSYTIVREMGGNLEITSARGEGTAVRMLLPPLEKSEKNGV
ncbi:MAG: ATP-binding protein [Desulfopila sp.]